MTNDTAARSAVPEPAGPAPVETLGAPDDGGPDGAAQPGGADRASLVGLAPSAVLAAAALAWLAAMLWVAHASISSDVGAVALATAASSMPQVVAAGIVAGAAAGLLAASLLARLRPGSAARAGLRSAVTLAVGAATGLAAGGAFIAGSGTDPARMAVAGTLGAAATVGGAVAGVRAARIVAAVVTAALAVFATGFVLEWFREPMQDFYGADGGEASRLSAIGWFAATAALASGVAAGLAAYRVLGGARRDPALRWPAYLAAGAGTGALLLVAEVIIRTGGAKLLGLVRQISEADRTVQAVASGSRVNNALVVLFVGGIIALVAHGRTIGPRDVVAGAPASAPADAPEHTAADGSPARGGAAGSADGAAGSADGTAGSAGGTGGD